MNPSRPSAKTCDVCKARKVRCLRSNGTEQRCINCVKRGDVCNFSKVRKRRSRNESPNVSTSGTSHADSPMGHKVVLQQRTVETGQVHGFYQPSITRSDDRTIEDSTGICYVDVLLKDSHATGRRQNGLLLESDERYVDSSGIAFFSKSKINALSKRLGHSRVKQLLTNLETMVKARVEEAYDPTDTPTTFQPSRSPTHDFKHSAKSYTESYFLHIHPIYPFLDRIQFENRASDGNLSEALKADKAWCALYFTVLALGSQFHGEGTFDQGNGKPWKLFQVALGTLPELMLPSKRLLNAQAVATMAIFSLAFSCLSVLELVVTEAARIATAMDLHICVGSDPTDVEKQRTFWTIYVLEKEFCFLAARVSTIADYDIGCPVPNNPTAVLGNLNWTLLSVRHSRILSKAYEQLFSISATLNSTAVYLQRIDSIRRDLDDWRDSLPPEFRPGSPIRQRDGDGPAGRFLILKIQYAYYHVLIALSRLTLHVCRTESTERLAVSESELMHSARSIIHLTQNIDLAPYTPTWILGHIPLSALFILFDFVIHNPTHPETRKNLAFLDIAAGYFTRLEFATEGSLQSSLLAEFAHIARQYVQDCQNGKFPNTQNRNYQGNDTPDSFSTMGMAGQQSSGSSSSANLAIPEPAPYETLQYEINEDGNSSILEEQPGFDFLDLFGNGHGDDMLTSELTLSFNSALYESQYLPWE